MRTLNSNEVTSTTNGVTCLTRLLEIVLSTGTRIFMTDFDIDLVAPAFDATEQTWSSKGGFTCSAIQSNVGTNSSNVTVEVALNVGTITKAMIEGGLLDDASVIIQIVDWQAPDNGAIEVFHGRVKTQDYADQLSVKFDVEPLFSRDVMLTVEHFTSNCRADLYDARCKIDKDLTANKSTFTVAADASNLQSFTTGLTQANGYFDFGLVVFSTGNNAGVAVEVGSYLNASGAIKLKLITPYPILAGDTGIIYRGCDKIITTCRDKWANVVNFRGEPFLPAPNATISTASPTGQPNTITATNSQPSGSTILPTATPLSH